MSVPENASKSLPICPRCGHGDHLYFAEDASGACVQMCRLHKVPSVRRAVLKTAERSPSQIVRFSGGAVVKDSVDVMSYWEGSYTTPPPFPGFAPAPRPIGTIRLDRLREDVARACAAFDGLRAKDRDFASICENLAAQHAAISGHFQTLAAEVRAVKDLDGAQ